MIVFARGFTMRYANLFFYVEDGHPIGTKDDVC